MEMTPPNTAAPETPQLTAEQVEAANFFIEECGLGAVADQQLTMMGMAGTVRYGLGRCAEYIMDLTPDEIRGMVLDKLKEQEEAAAPQPS